jgi:hypothetical protein
MSRNDGSNERRPHLSPTASALLFEAFKMVLPAMALALLAAFAHTSAL